MPGADPELSDDPAALAAAARRYLREKFLTAGVAISGANFAVAETGTLVVVESEGNGRMCLSLAHTLISVVGIEKLVPTWQDLEVFLQLLPRSSTAERMNPYTSMWTGVTPGDGPQSVHVVLVDNGRSAVLADSEGRDALHCIRCSACLNVCPVYERVGGHAYGSAYPGPIGAVLSPQLTGIDENDSLPFASSLCGACYEVCPVKIDIPTMLVHLRTIKVDGGLSPTGPTAPPAPPPGAKRPASGPGRRSPAERFGSAGEAALMSASRWVMSSPNRWRLATRAARAGRWISDDEGRISHVPPPLSRWTRSRDLPSPLLRRSAIGGPGPRGAGMAEGPAGARSELLARIAAALGRAASVDRAFDPRATVGGVARHYRRAGAQDPRRLVDEFAGRAADYGAAVSLIGREDDLAAAIARCTESGRVVAAPGVDPSWLSAIPDAERDDESRTFLDLASGGVAVTASRGGRLRHRDAGPGPPARSGAPGAFAHP